MNYKIFFFNGKTIFIQKIGILFHSITVKGKNELQKKFCFILNKGNLSTFLLLKATFCCGTILER